MKLEKRISTEPIKGTFKNDSLPYAIKRFEYIIINAFASFLKPGNVVKQNIALTDNLEGLIDSKYQTSDASIKQNIIEFIGERDSKDTETNERNINADIIKRLLRAIWNHPIFNLFDDTKDETTILLLGKQPGLDKSKDEIQKLKAGLDNYTVKEIMNFSFEKVENMIHNFEKLESKIYITTGNDFKFSTEFGSRNKKYPALLERYRELNLLMNKPSDGVKFGQNRPRF